MTNARDRRDAQRGIILPSVLIMLAFASTIVMLMLTVQEIAVDRSIHFSEAAQAQAYAKGGELSVILALRRDGREAPDNDNLTEPWATIADRSVAIENGRFSLAASDAQARYNVNNLAEANAADTEIFKRIVALLKLPGATAGQVADFVRSQGGIASLGDLTEAGVPPSAIAALDTLVTALPVTTTVNVSTASEPLLSAILGNQVSASQLAMRRKRNGYLDAAALSELHVIAPVGLGFTSAFYDVDTRITVGNTTQSFKTTLHRAIDASAIRVDVIRRLKREGAPLGAPSLQGG